MKYSDHKKHAQPNGHDEHSTHEKHTQNSNDHKEHSSHSGSDHSGHEQMFRTRFWWSLLLTIPVLLYSSSLQSWLGFSMPAFPGSSWIPFIFSLVIFAYGGIPFL